MDDRDWIVFRVSDTGIGLSAEQMVRLFQPFTQADASTTRRFGGTGLGLALTRRFCQMMDGDVSISSVPEQGSVVTIKLPAVLTLAVPERDAIPQEDVEVREDDRTSEPPPPPGTCVLVIDDDAAQRELMHRYLRKEGFTVCTASGGAMGLRMARQLLPAAITLDVMMPGVDGWMVLSALKNDARLRHIPVIMLTMMDDPARGFTLGASEYATKPVDRQRLSQIIRKFTSLRTDSPVLVIDDEPSARSLTRGILEKDGWTVVEAGNGVEALEEMTRRRPSLIFLDLMMPEMDGFEFAAEISRHSDWRTIPIVVVTARDLSVEDRRRLRGYVETILKKQGDTKEALLEKVRDVLRVSTEPRVRMAEMEAEST